MIKDEMTLVGNDLITLNFDKDNKKFPWYIALFKEGDKTVFVHEHVYEDDAKEEFYSWRHLQKEGDKRPTPMSHLLGRVRWKQQRFDQPAPAE